MPLQQIIPKLPMRNLALTKAYYTENLGFEELGNFGNYLILGIGNLEIHFFEHSTLNPLENYGQVYIRTQEIEAFYKRLLTQKVAIHPNGALEAKPWRQLEFSLLDPDNNLLTFGEEIK